MQKIILFVAALFLFCQSSVALSEQSKASGEASNAVDQTLPTLLVTDAPKVEKEPIRIQSVFGTSNLKEFTLPFEDNYPTATKFNCNCWIISK